MRLRSTRIGFVLCTVALGALLLGAFAGKAAASEPFADPNVSFVSLQVDKTGEALVTYRRADGKLRHVLVWGAVNALPPVKGVPQVHFLYDYAGGWRKHHERRLLEELQERLQALRRPGARVLRRRL